MNKNTCKTVRLSKGEMHIYDFGAVKLHAYRTNDPICDEVFVLEKNGKAVIIESPCFFDNNSELAEYVRDADRLSRRRRLIPARCAQICHAERR